MFCLSNVANNLSRFRVIYIYYVPGVFFYTGFPNYESLKFDFLGPAVNCLVYDPKKRRRG